MINEIKISAKIVSDISLRITNQKSIPVSDFRIIHKNKKAKNPVFIDVEIWGEDANIVYDNIRRGDNVLITGELRCDSWTSKDTSEKRTKIKITASKVSIIDSFINNELMDNYVK